MTASKILKWKELFVALFLSIYLIITITAIDPDLVGPYCATRANLCCPGRRDDCSVPILGTLCYCDDFCNRTRNEDCCPDFWSYCKGIVPPPPNITLRTCKDHQGRIYNEGETVQINCNQCKCQEMNNKMEFLCETNVCLIDELTIERVNRDYRTYGWRASNYSYFWGKKHEEGVALRLGTLHSRKKVLEMEPIKEVINVSAIPRRFDSRTNWPGLISLPKDQGWCGASWVFSTTAVVSDRFGIFTHGMDYTYLSSQHLLDCSINTQRGCHGGHLTRAWMFIRKYGLVSESCYPWESVSSNCRIVKRKKATEANCPSFISSKSELHRVGPVYRVATEDGIKHEIMKNGPVQAVMRVSRDFFSYKGGIYRCSALSTFDRSGYHAVRIIGWDEELHNNQLMKYWIVSNSWGEWWGEEGFFRIRRGSNECLIEEFVIAAWPKIDNFNVIYDTAKFSRNNNLPY